MQRTAPEVPDTPERRESCTRPGRSAGKRCWRSATRKRGPYPAHEGQGRTCSDDCPGQSDGTRLRRGTHGLAGSFLGPAFSSGSPHQSVTPSPPHQQQNETSVSHRKPAAAGAAWPRHQLPTTTGKPGAAQRRPGRQKAGSTMDYKQTLDNLEAMAVTMMETAQSIMDAVAIERAAIRCYTGEGVT